MAVACKPKRSASLHRKVAQKRHAKRPTPKRPHAHKRKGAARPVGSGHAGTGSRCLKRDQHGRFSHGKFTRPG